MLSLALIFSPDCDSLNKYMYLHVNFDMYNTTCFVLGNNNFPLLCTPRNLTIRQRTQVIK